tara:strand:- start:51819 stop:52571 length:753 start_codon:yes stop_codon:yes gene_type:complete
MKSLILLLITVTTAGLSISSAQTLPEETVNVTFRAFTWDRVNDNIIYYRDGSEEVRLRLPWMKRSEVLRYEGPPVLQFYQKRKNKKGEWIQNPVASVDFSQSTIESPLLLFYLEKGNGSAKFGARILNDDMEDFPFGSYRVVNLTPASIRGHIGNDVFSLKPGQSTTVTPKKLISNDRNVVVEIQTPVDGEYKSVSESVWTYHPDGRTICFLIENGQKGRDYFKINVMSEFESDNPPSEDLEVRRMDVGN